MLYDEIADHYGLHDNTLDHRRVSNHREITNRLQQDERLMVNRAMRLNEVDDKFAPNGISKFGGIENKCKWQRFMLNIRVLIPPVYSLSLHERHKHLNKWPMYPINQHIEQNFWLLVISMNLKSTNLPVEVVVAAAVFAAMV